MASLTDNPLSEVLIRHREDFNRRFLRARHNNRRLSGGQFSSVLKTKAAPIVQAVAAVSPESLDESVSALYDICLRLTGLDLLGPGSHMDALDQAFVQLLPMLGRLIAKAPESIVGSVANAVYNLELEPAADAQRWIGIMQNIAGREIDTGQFLDVGTVAAWVCGMAHYRQSALKTAKKLPLGLLSLVFGLRSEQSEASLHQKLSNPWYHPLRQQNHTVQLQRVAHCGGFRGFGGPFVDPPEVTRFGDQLYAFDSQCAWLIFADAHGVVLRRFGSSLPEGDPEDRAHFGLDRKGNVSRNDLKAHLPELASWSSLASTEHTLAVALPHSHRIFLVAAA